MALEHAEPVSLVWERPVYTKDDLVKEARVSENSYRRTVSRLKTKRLMQQVDDSL